MMTGTQNHNLKPKQSMVNRMLGSIKQQCNKSGANKWQCTYDRQSGEDSSTDTHIFYTPQ